MSNDLDAVIEGTETETEEVVEQVEVEESKGEEVAAPPAEDQASKEAEGLRAAKIAETRRRQEAEERAAELQRKLDAMQSPVPEEKGKPTSDQFDSYDEFIEALTEWKVEEREKAREVNEKASAQQKQAHEAHMRYASNAAKFMADHPDFEQITANPDLQITDPMAAAIRESDAGPDIAYSLGKNPQEAARISQLSPASQIREIGKLEAKLTSAFEAAIKEEQKTNKLPGSLSNERAAADNGSETFVEPALEDLFPT